jgi:hypothetical protein
MITQWFNRFRQLDRAEKNRFHETCRCLLRLMSLLVIPHLRRQRNAGIDPPPVESIRRLTAAVRFRPGGTGQPRQGAALPSSSWTTAGLMLFVLELRWD